MGFRYSLPAACGYERMNRLKQAYHLPNGMPEGITMIPPMTLALI